MGAVPYVGGVTFRVWAKFPAQGQVFVAGDFNGWSTSANPLAPDGASGYWSVDVPGAKAGDKYKFCIPGPGLRVDPYATSVFKDEPAGAQDLQMLWKAAVSSNDVDFDTTTGFTMPNWNELVVYELHVGTFTTQPDGSEGTLISALDKLKDVADPVNGLGINAIEIMPLGEYTTLTSSGYNPGYIFAVEDQYGGPDAFRGFVNRFWAPGSRDSRRGLQPPGGNTDLWQFDDVVRRRASSTAHGSNLQPGADARRRIYFYQDNHSATPTTPMRGSTTAGRRCSSICATTCRGGWRLASSTGYALIRWSTFAGFSATARTTSSTTPDGKALLLTASTRRCLRGVQPWKLTIAEDLQGWDGITAPVASGGMGFSAQWNESLCYALRGAVIPASDAARPMQPIIDALNGLSGPNAFKYVVIYSENHDKDDASQGGGRLPDLIHPGQSNSWESKKRSTLAVAVVMTAPAIPMIFEGQEFLAWQPFPNGGATPAPLDWTMATTFAGIRNLYRDMIHLRRNWFNNTRGLQGANLQVLPVFADNMLVYHRWNQGGAGDDVVVVCNFANQGYGSYAIGLPQPGMWRVRFNSDAGIYDASFSNWNSFDTSADGPALNGMPYSGNVGIAPYSCIILSQGWSWLLPTHRGDAAMNGAPGGLGLGKRKRPRSWARPLRGAS